MAVLNNSPLPFSEPISRPKRKEFRGEQRDPQEGLVSKSWADYLRTQSELTEKFPARVSTVELSGQTSSIGATDMTDGTLTAGLYRGGYNLRITQADAGGATVAVVIDWTGDSGITRQIAFAAISAASVNTFQVSNFIFRLDALSPVRYSTTVVAGGGNMIYALDVVVEEVKA